MSLLFRVLRAAHARGTHHKLALDATTRFSRRDADAWQRLFLKHAQLYMQGAKAPDDEFKDFKNHVLHPRDGYWGGAPEKVEAWYGHLVAALKAENWSEAVWCAGVLSHYFTDPLHPFHTAQSEAENNIHAAVEWSINRGYDDLYREGLAAHGGRDVVLPPVGPGWIKALMCACADTSNAQYEKLIAHYDFNRGVVAPVEGLDSNARRIVAELLVHAATGFARLLERAIDEAAVAPPAVSLTLDTILATLAMPVKALLKKLGDAADRKAIEAMYDELQATGRVEHHLRADDRAVRDAFNVEVMAPRLAKTAQKRAVRATAAAPPAAAPRARLSIVKALPPAAPVGGDANSGTTFLGRATAPAEAPVATPPPIPAARPQVSAPAAPATQQSVPAVPRAAPPRPAVVAERPADPVPPPSLRTVSSRASAAPRARLAPADDLEAAPSIGPKTAERFAAVGIKTVADFLAADAVATAARLGVRHITALTIDEWQDQARLVMTIPGLRGGHAQLLTGAGFRAVEDIARAAPDELCARVLAFAASPEGHRILRDAEAPDVERIKGWVDAAATALAA